MDGMGKKLKKDPFQEMPLDSRADDSEFRDIYLKFYHLLLYFFQGRGFASPDAQDLAQQTFLAAYTAKDRFRGESSLKNWLLMIASNLLINHIRRNNAAKRAGDEVRLELIEDPISEEDNPEKEIIFKEQRQKLQEALVAMPPRMRHLISLRVLHGLSYKEIATILNISINTVKSCLYQARIRLKDFIELKVEKEEKGH